VNMRPDQPTARHAIAGRDETGRACPYCQLALEEGVAIAVCGACGAVHHGDCWRDGGGCAVLGCTGAVSVAGARPPDLPTPLGYPPVTHQPAVPAGPGYPPPPQAAPGGTDAASTVPLAAAGTQPEVVMPLGAPGRTGGPLGASAPSPAPLGALAWQSPPPPSPPTGRNLPVAAAIVVLAIAVAGAAVGIVLSRQSAGDAHNHTVTKATVPSKSPPAPGIRQSTTTNPSAADEATATGTTATTTTAATGTGALPPVSTQQMQAEIQHMLLEWHEDVVHGNDQGAWKLLSRRKQEQDSSEYGYATWAKNQDTLRPYLNPAGLRVTVEHTEPSSGVAQVDVTGMTWDKPGASCAEWSGITWVKYEEGAWKYDPGYSTTPQREREWKSRYSELLGGRC